VTVMQTKPAAQLDFVLRCKNATSPEFELVSATAEQAQPSKAPTTCKFNITKVGTGQGSVSSSNDAENHFAGRKLALTAKPNADSYFSGWGGDIEILDEEIDLVLHSDTSVTAQFELKILQDTGMALTFESAQKITLTTGEPGFAFTLRLTNQTDKQLRLTLPRAVYINARGEEIDQSDWVSGMLDGEVGGTLRAGNSRQMGLVFTCSRLSECATGDQLCVTVMQTKPAAQLDFVLRCKNATSQEFELVSATAEQAQPSKAPADTAALPAMATMQAQIEALQAQLLGMTQAIAKSPAAVTRITHPTPSQTLPEVLAWLCTQASVPMAVLRLKLLPLDLMPSAVIDDINERAYDLAGEAALEEAGDAVAVQRGVLLQVLAVWEV